MAIMLANCEGCKVNGDMHAVLVTLKLSRQLERVSYAYLAYRYPCTYVYIYICIYLYVCICMYEMMNSLYDALLRIKIYQCPPTHELIITNTTITYRNGFTYIHL